LLQIVVAMLALALDDPAFRFAHAGYLLRQDYHPGYIR